MPTIHGRRREIEVTGLEKYSKKVAEAEVEKEMRMIKVQSQEQLLEMVQAMRDREMNSSYIITNEKKKRQDKYLQERERMEVYWSTMETSMQKKRHVTSNNRFEPSDTVRVPFSTRYGQKSPVYQTLEEKTDEYMVKKNKLQ